MTPPEGHRWHNPEHLPDPLSGWRYCLEAEVDSNVFAKTTPCKVWSNTRGRWDDSTSPASEYNVGYTYLVPDTTPFDIPTTPPPSVSRNSQSHAFPSVDYTQEGVPIPGSQQMGLTKREWLAGMAMQGYATLVTPENCRIHAEKGPKIPIEEYMAVLSVQMADALIAALSKKEEA